MEILFKNLKKSFHFYLFTKEKRQPELVCNAMPHCLSQSGGLLFLTTHGDAADLARVCRIRGIKLEETVFADYHRQPVVERDDVPGFYLFCVREQFEIVHI